MNNSLSCEYYMGEVGDLHVARVQVPPSATTKQIVGLFVSNLLADGAGALYFRKCCYPVCHILSTGDRRLQLQDSSTRFILFYPLVD